MRIGHENAKKIENLAADFRGKTKMPFPLSTDALKNGTELWKEALMDALLDPGTGKDPARICEAAVKQAVKKHAGIPSGTDDPWKRDLEEAFVLAVLLPKEEFISICWEHSYEGLLGPWTHYGEAAEECGVTKETAYERQQYLLDNHLWH